MKPAYLILFIAVVFIINGCLYGATESPKWLTSTDIHDVWDTNVFSAQSTVDGKIYKVEVYGRDFNTVAQWDAKHSFPLSLDQMRTSSLEAFRKRFPDFDGYSITSIQIINVRIIDKWLGDIKFDRIDQEGTVISTIYFLMLPNGKIITP